MDLSKLPRLSNTPKPPSDGAPAASGEPAQPKLQPANADPSQTPAGMGADIWFMTIVGVVLILIGRSFISYEFAQLRHQTYHTGVNWGTGDKAGEEVAYPELDMGIRGGQYYTDSCLVLLGIALVLDGIARALAIKRVPGGLALLGFTIVLTLATVAYNFHVAAKYFAVGSLPFISCLAIAAGGYLGIMQIALFKSLRLGRGGM